MGNEEYFRDTVNSYLQDLYNDEFKQPIIEVSLSGYKIPKLAEIYTYVALVKILSNSRKVSQLKVRGLLNGRFTFRGSPGKVKERFSYFEFIFNGENFSMHQGLSLQGISGQDHELDVSIVREGDDRPVFCFFVKAYDKSNLTREKARAFVGVMQDFPYICMKRKIFFALYGKKSTSSISNFYRYYLQRHGVYSKIIEYPRGSNSINFSNNLDSFESDIEKLF